MPVGLILLTSFTAYAIIALVHVPHGRRRDSGGMGQLCSVYRLTVDQLDDALKPEHGGERFDLQVAGHTAVRVDVERADHPPEWAPALAAMTGHPYLHQVRSASAVLLVDLGAAQYALAFGAAGRHLLHREAFQPDFGIAIAIRCLDPNQILTVARTALDLTSRTDLTQLPSGESVLVFGVDRYREIVKRVAGRSGQLKTAQLARKATVRLDAGNPLQTRIATSPDGLIADLTAIEDAYQEDPHPELAFVEGLRPVTRDHGPRQALAAELTRPDSDRIGLAIPGAVGAAEVSSGTIEVEGRQYPIAEPDLAAITAPVRELPESRCVEALRAGQLTVTVAHETDPIETPLISWLAADLAIGDQRYVLHGGRFYRMTEAYRHALDAQVTDLLGRSAGLTLPPWPASEGEHTYCERVEREVDGFVMLDRRRATSDVHPRGVEICDLLGPGGELICVKRANGSSVLSHLFFQGIVAAEAIYHGRGQQLRQMLPEHRRGDIPQRPQFVFAIQLTKGELTAKSLFSLAKVGLNCAAQHLHRLAMNVSVVSIDTA